MYHNNHCTNCGNPMSHQNRVCQTPDCRIAADAMPVWPWSRCSNCGDWAFRIISQWRLARLIWPIALGILLLLSGIFSFSVRLQFIGIILIGGWHLSRLAYRHILKVENDKLIQEQKRNVAKQKFGTPAMPDTDENRKKLKDEYDAVRSLEWKVISTIRLRSITNLGIALFILFQVISWGPGSILPPFGSWLKQSTDEVLQKSISQEIIQESKTVLNWDTNKIRALNYELKSTRGLTNSQVETILKHPEFNVDLIFKELRKTSFGGVNLCKYLDSVLNMATKQPIQEVTRLKEKGYIQKVKEASWIILFFIFFLLTLIFSILAAEGIASFFFHLAYEGGDELKDQIKLILEKHTNPVIEQGAAATASPIINILGQIKKEGKGIAGHVFTIGLVSGILDWVFAKIFRRK